MKKDNEKNKVFTLKETIVLTLISNLLIFVTLGIILYNNYEKNSGISYNNLAEDSALKEFLEVYDSVTNDYYEDVDKQKILDVAINSMMEYLGDTYTGYVDKDENELINEIITGEYVGIGIEVSNDNLVRKVYDDSPAKEVGLQINDKLIKVDNITFVDGDNAEALNYIKNKINEKIKLTVLRGTQQLSFDIVPSNIKKNIVSSAVLENNDKKIGYITFSTFSNNLPEQVEESLKKLEKEKISGLIIDLRNNNGGVLNAVKPIANLFLKKGKLIFSLENKVNIIKYKDDTEEYRSYPISVLINGNTASAAEILTAALKDSYNATIIGEKSYGKGKVQQIMNLTNGSAVKYTSAKWYTPKNKCIDGEGITPDYLIKNNYTEETKVYVDNQLKKALDILS